MTEQSLLSIVVTSYTTARMPDIYELLSSVKAQTYPNLETIFVTERSKELYEKVKAYSRKEVIPNMKVMFNEGEQGASAARNLGIRQAKGDIIAFVDDDSVPFPDWAEEMIKSYEDTSIIGVTGPAFPLWEDESMSWFPEEFYWIISCTAWGNWNGIAEVRNVWLQNASFRRGAFEQAGFLDVKLGPRDSTQGFKGREFKDGLISEEVELSLRVKEATGKCIIFNPGVRVKHKVYKERLKLSYITHWAYWMGLSKHKLKKLYPQTNGNLLSQEHQLLRRIFTRLFPGILKTLLINPIAAWHKLRVTVTALFFVAAGYYSHLFSGLFAGQRAKIH